jgi:hypothetical protein
MADELDIPDVSSSASRLAELRKYLRPYWICEEAGGIAPFVLIVDGGSGSAGRRALL